MTILSVVPGIGATLVWVPTVIYLYALGQPLAATLLAIWCAGVVGTVDNVLRPYFVGKDAEIPDLLILTSTQEDSFSSDQSALSLDLLFAVCSSQHWISMALPSRTSFRR